MALIKFQAQEETTYEEACMLASKLLELNSTAFRYQLLERARISDVSIAISLDDSLNCLGLLPFVASFKVTLFRSKSKSMGVSRLASMLLNPVSLRSCINAEYLGPNPAIN